MRLVVADERALRPAAEDLRRCSPASTPPPAASARTRHCRAPTPAPGGPCRPPAGRSRRRRPRRRPRATAPSTPRSASRCTASATTATSPPSAHAAAALRRADVPGPPARRSGWRRVRLHREAGLLTVPAGTALDLGATAKAWTADHAARTLAARYGTGCSSSSAGTSPWPAITRRLARAGRRTRGRQRAEGARAPRRPGHLDDHGPHLATRRRARAPHRRPAHRPTGRRAVAHRVGGRVARWSPTPPAPRRSCWARTPSAGSPAGVWPPGSSPGRHGHHDRRLAPRPPTLGSVPAHPLAPAHRAPAKPDGSGAA